MTNYSFWKLYKSQWTFKNETCTLVCMLLASLILTSILFISGMVVGLVPLAPVIVCLALLICWFLIHQVFKVVVFFFLCYFVNYLVTEKEPLSVENYNRLLNRLK